MNVFIWIIFGLIIGVIANFIDPIDRRGGLLGTALLGILGSLLGGFLGNLFFGVVITGFNLSSFVAALAGAVVLLFLERAFRRT